MTVGLRCKSCGIFVDMQGKEHIIHEKPFAPPMPNFYVVVENNYGGGYGAMYYIVYASQDLNKIVEFCKNRYKDFREIHDYTNDYHSYGGFYIRKLILDANIKEFIGGYIE